MIAWIKKYGKIIIGALLAIGGLIIGLVINKESRRVSDAIGCGISGSNDAGQELASGLGKLEINQQSASHRLDDLADANQRLASGQQDASRIIDSAEAKLDRIDSLLGIDKDK
jgi:hypothetical protein